MWGKEKMADMELREFRLSSSELARSSSYLPCTASDDSNIKLKVLLLTFYMNEKNGYCNRFLYSSTNEHIYVQSSDIYWVSSLFK